MRLDRARLFAFAGILCAINGCATAIIRAVKAVGLLEAGTYLLGVSAVVWFALFIVERVSAQDLVPEPVSRPDAAMALGMLFASAVPVATFASAALTVGGTWLVISGEAASRSRRVGLVLVAVSITLIWGRLGIALFGPSLLTLDAALVSAISGTSHDGNLVYFSGSAQQFVIGAPCSSVHNLTLATLLWTSISAYLRIPLDTRWFVTCAAASAAVVLVNAVRLAAIALYPANFTLLHDGWLAQSFGAASLVAAALVILISLNNARTRASI